MLHIWNHTVGDILKLAFFTQHNAFEIHPSCCTLCQLFIPFHCWVAFHCMERPRLAIPLLEDILVDSSFWFLQIKLLWITMYRFFCGHVFTFFPGVQVLGPMVSGRLVLKETTQLSSRVAVPSCSHQWCPGDPVSLHACQHLVLILFILASYIGTYCVLLWF